MTLAAEEFLRRFVQHVLPKGFVKVRHYGLLANRHREEKLAVCRRLLLVETVAARLVPGEADEPEPTVIEPARVRCCPQCGSRRLILVTCGAGGRAPPRAATRRKRGAGRVRRRAAPAAAAGSRCARPRARADLEPPRSGGKVHRAGSRGRKKPLVGRKRSPLYCGEEERAGLESPYRAGAGSPAVQFNRGLSGMLRRTAEGGVESLTAEHAG